MTHIIQKFVKAIMLVLFVIGAGLILKNKVDSQRPPPEAQLSEKPLALKKFLLTQEKPQRIEIFGLSDRFEKEIKEIKKLKVAQDPNSDFYITVQLFSDENDTSAPLIAQIRFIDLKSGNLRKEESINLE